MSLPSISAMLVALSAKAKANAGLLALVGGDATKIANYLSQDAQLPWVRFSIPSLTEFDTKDDDGGFNGTLQFDFWCDYRGSLLAAQAADSILAAVKLDASFIGPYGLYVRHSSYSNSVSGDGVVYHTSCNFEFISTL
jgi:hypothetical protein